MRQAHCPLSHPQRQTPHRRGVHRRRRPCPHAGTTKSYIAKFRDAAGYWIERPTGCSDETAARAVLAQLVRRAELIRAGVITPEEDAASRHGAESIETNLDAWRDHLRLKGSTEHWYIQARRRVARVATDRGVKRLRDFTAATVERWLRDQADTGMSAGTRNGYTGRRASRSSTGASAPGG
ncbi:MAG: hypothetical protein KGS45_10910 [Planctomycetes bacterium]|nr:hypothetical protein [Planctomycetota bacterium]